ncbi:5d0d15e6-e5ed-4b4e-9bc4-b6d77273428b [Thermothielavioides terrestris]|uniref:5d0d15e6-e5ed-4b4e-9bc4-b6d77273428b n=1 Tax=Thermothielavioides terrestris TaxID=2587410 RepID=A0A3S4C4K3_9PEZI|nr:5d0d15e6-e5ed-4b4e-9bc4-b6d77273428b [Thermothielavioides terrestris]
MSRNLSFLNIAILS